MKLASLIQRVGLTLITIGLSQSASTANAFENRPLPTVDQVDLARYVGTWYEIALLPNRFESQCASDTQARYTVQEGGIQVLNRCRKADGKVDSAEGRAKIVDSSSNAKLKVTFFWPFYGDDWILALDANYTEVLVGTPDRRYGWILARQPDLAEARVQALLERARELGFDAQAFKRIPHLKPLDTAP